MNEKDKTLVIEDVDVSHLRLVELTNLADQGEAFYEWVEAQFQAVLSRQESLENVLKTATKSDLEKAISACYQPQNPGLPLLFDGVGRTYTHEKACYYFFSWLIRDAPQQRLRPLIGRITKNLNSRDKSKKSKHSHVDVEARVLASLIFKYRENVKTFSWTAVREVFIDRLEGSRRSLEGHRKEAVVRTALIAAFQNYFIRHNNYGKYASVKIAEKQVTVGNQTFDVSADLLNNKEEVVRRIFVPVKTRETEGGGHAHLYSRDITPAISAIRNGNSNDFLSVVIVAQNWSARETAELRGKIDHVAIFDINPSDFSEFGEIEQRRLSDFISSVLDDNIQPKL